MTSIAAWVFGIGYLCAVAWATWRDIKGKRAL
jgi:hypothetical protein